MKRELLVLSCTALLSALGSTAYAADYYVDPQSGSAGNPGSQASPWKTLEQVVASGLVGTTVKPGDTLHLRAGYHGELNLTSGSFDPPITILADPGEAAKLGRVRFGATSGWVLRGVSVSPSYAPSYSTITMVDIGKDASDVTVQDCDIFSVDDASSWTASDWMDVASSGISAGGTKITLRGNKVRNVRFGIGVTAPGAMIDRNQVVGFSADGLRGLGDDETFQYNLVEDSYIGTDLDPNHDDGFQSWSVGPNGVGTGEVKNMVLRGNVIINSRDPERPLRSTIQGIGCFDGFFTNWVVEDNVVIVHHWHGISLYGAKDSRIVNNTVIDIEDGTPGPPWIMVTDHKDGTPSQNVVVRNNLTMDLKVSGDAITEDHDTLITKADFAKYFVDAAKLDVHLLPDAPAIDQGSSELAPAEDADGIARPQGNGIDLGAFEWHDPSVVPDAGAGVGGMGDGGSGSATTTAGSGGSDGTGGDAPAAAGSSGESSGCGCRIEPADSASREAALAFVGVALAFASRHRRRSRRAPRAR